MCRGGKNSFDSVVHSSEAIGTVLFSHIYFIAKVLIDEKSNVSHFETVARYMFQMLLIIVHFCA